MHATEDRIVEGHLGDVRAMLRHALAGGSMTLDRHAYSLHDLTQVALALQPDATLAIRNGELMAPIERASVASVGRGQVVFV